MRQMQCGIATRRAMGARAAAILLTLILSLTLWRAALADGGHVPVSLIAGETYVFKDLSPDARPQVTYADPNSFMLQCDAPGRCYVLGTGAGRGSVRAMRSNGTAVVYDLTIRAAAQPGNPLAPGTWTANTGGRSLSASSYDQSSVASGSSPASAGVEIEKAQAPSYSHNPVVNEVAMPPEVTPSGAGYLPPGTVSLISGSSRVFSFNSPLRRVSIANSAVADVQVVSPEQVMLVGHQPGFTTLGIWNQRGDYYERRVRIDRDEPEEVQLNVVVAELNRTKLEQQGIDISAALANTGLSLVGLPGNVATPYSAGANLAASGGIGTLVPLPPNGVVPTGGGLIPLLLSPSLTYGLASQNGQVATNTFIQLLEQHDLARILSAPRLIAESGEEAQFLSGGEIPIVVAQALNTSIIFKQFGTSVKFVPTVIDSGEIDLIVKPEFSQPDYTQGVQLFGFTVPAFITRRAETRVRMHENQTLIIAGLILDTTRSELQKVPYLGDLPYLGAFFRHTYWNHLKSELVMTVMPQIIRPIPDGATLVLPTQTGPMTPEEVRTRPLAVPDVTRPRFP